MAYKEVFRVEILEVIRHWQLGESRRQIASGTGLSKDTVGKYISAAEGLGVSLDGASPDEEQLSQLAAISRSGPRKPEAPTEDKLAPWADQIYQWLTEDRMQLTRIQELLSASGCSVSYASLQRFVHRRNWRRRNSATVRMEDTAPGEVVELDFGRLGLIHDPDTGHLSRVKHFAGSRCQGRLMSRIASPRQGRETGLSSPSTPARGSRVRSGDLRL